MKFAFYCKCGATMVGEVEPDAGVAGLRGTFLTVHCREDCGVATQREAANARRRKDRQLLAGVAS